MRSIRKIGIRLCLIIFIVIAVESAVRYGYESWSAPTRLSRIEREQLEGELDTLYLGTSVTYRGFNPQILDEELGSSSFNLGSAGQSPVGAYYLLRETAEKNPIRRVYMTISLPEIKKDTTDLVHSYRSAFENMYSWKWRLALLMDVNREDLWTCTLFYSTRVEDYFDLSTVKKNLKKKLSKTLEAEGYGGRGYRLFQEKPYKGREVRENEAQDAWYAGQGEAQIQPEALDALDRIAKFCREEEIELTYVILPASQVYLDGAGDLDAMNQYFEKWTGERGANLYNFFLYKDRQEVFDNSMFADSVHLRNEGGAVFSHLLAEIEKSGDPQSYFLDSMEEF